MKKATIVYTSTFIACAKNIQLDIIMALAIQGARSSDVCLRTEANTKIDESKDGIIERNITIDIPSLIGNLVTSHPREKYIGSN